MQVKSAALTAPRRKVIDALKGTKVPLGAYEIVDKIGDIKPMSVYRALDFLTREGLVHRIESLNAYVSCAEAHCEHTDSQYMICESCGRVEELHDHALDDFIEKAAVRKKFTISRKTLELRGLCHQCS